MKRIVPLVVVAIYLSAPALCNSLYVKKNGTEVVFTNINRASFFKRAFSIGKHSHYSKNKVINLIKKTALKMGVNPKLVLAIAKIESDFNNNSTSKSGAKGVMQLIDKTARFYGVKDVNNLEENIAGGIKFLKHLSKKYKDIRLVAAAYNAGETAVDRYKGIPPFKETRRYVKKFTAVFYGKNTPKTKVRYVKKTHIHYKPIRRIGNVYSNVGGSIW